MNRTIERWKSIKYVIPGSFLWQSIQDMQELARQRDELLAELQSVLPWVVTQEVACNGLKCREAVCMSCSFDSESAAQKASDAYHSASCVLAKIKEQTK